ncbi:hypothetical protein GCM10011533_00390 [Streptosporangium jomthongense]|nr:hypothetical protein GCM10011533_00390 [Streptosporangium jomthongense]
MIESMNSARVENGVEYYARFGDSDHGKQGLIKKGGVKKTDTPGFLKARGVRFGL